MVVVGETGRTGVPAFLKKPDTHTDENDGQDNNKTTDERPRPGEGKAADQKILNNSSTDSSQAKDNWRRQKHSDFLTFTALYHKLRHACRTHPRQGFCAALGQQHRDKSRTAAPARGGARHRTTGKGRFRGQLLVPRTAGIGPTRPLRRIPAIVSFVNPQPAFSLAAGTALHAQNRSVPLLLAMSPMSAGPAGRI